MKAPKDPRLLLLVQSFRRYDFQFPGTPHGKVSHCLGSGSNKRYRRIGVLDSCKNVFTDVRCDSGTVGWSISSFGRYSRYISHCSHICTPFLPIHHEAPSHGSKGQKTRTTEAIVIISTGSTSPGIFLVESPCKVSSIKKRKNGHLLKLSTVKRIWLVGLMI